MENAAPGDFFKAEELPLVFLDEVSVFETLRIYSKRAFRFGEHYQRLGESCRAIGKENPFSEEALGRWVEEGIVESGFEGVLLRLSLHWDPEVEGDGQLVGIFRNFEAYPPSLYEKGIAVQTTVSRRWTLKAQDPRIKASQFVSGVLATIDKTEEGIHELLFLGPSGTVAEGTISNIFIVKHKRLLTPSVSSGILKGVTRGVVMEIAQARGFSTQETFLTRHELYTADECFMTNTSSEVLAVTSVDHRRIGLGVPGSVTLTLAKDFKDKIKKELGMK